MTLLVPPVQVAAYAELGLATRDRIQAGGTARTVRLAVKLAGRTPCDVDDLHTIVSASTHPVTAALVGGPEGRRWATTMLARHVAAIDAAATPAGQARNRLRRVAVTLARIDAELRAQLTAAAATALAQALAHAGVKLRVKAAARRAKGATVLDGYTALLDDGRTSPALLAAVGVTERDLVAGQFDAFAATAAVLVADAQRRRRQALQRHLRLDGLDDEWAADEERHRDGAVALLAAGMLAVALERLSVPEPVFDGRGELPAIVSVPPDLIGETVRAANGAAVVVSPGVLPSPAPLSIPGTAVDDGPNPLVADAVGRAVPDAVIFQVWEHGDPARPFEPHLDLHGFRSDDGGVSWYDPTGGPESAVVKSFDEWPYEHDHYFPGDHQSCQCATSSGWDVFD